MLLMYNNIYLYIISVSFYFHIKFVGKRDRCGLKKGAIPSIFNNSIDTSKTNYTTTDSLKQNTELSDSVNSEQLNNQKCSTPLLRVML